MTVPLVAEPAETDSYLCSIELMYDF